jgi:hypothetical protein
MWSASEKQDTEQLHQLNRFLSHLSVTFFLVAQFFDHSFLLLFAQSKCLDDLVSIDNSHLMFSKSSFANDIMSRSAPFSSQTLPSANYGTYGQPVVSSNPPPSSYTFDPRNLEIKTKSVEQTLLPLVTQISTLVNFKESIMTGGRPKSERAMRAALKVYLVKMLYT